MFALAAALQIGLHAKSERILEAVLCALLAGDAALLVALALMAAEEGWTLNATNTFGLMFTIVCVAVRLVLLRDWWWWTRRSTRPQRLAVLSQELDSVQHVVQRSVELTPAMTHNVVDRAEAANGAVDPLSDALDAGRFKED